MSKQLNPWKIPGYKAGQNISCKVVAQEPGGYAVNIHKDNLPGFLPTEGNLKVGEEVLAQFVCIHNNRILLSSRFSASTAMQRPQQKSSQGQWEQELSGSTAAAGGSAQPVQTTEDQAEEAFRVWTQGNPRKYHLRRATDLLMPPIDDLEPHQFKISDYDLEWLITDLEGGMRTACVKASSEERLSRSAMLLYRGRVVACIYGSKSLSDTLPTEQSLLFMLKDLALPETQVKVYDLPEKVTLPMSAMFMGYPVQRAEDIDARSYMDYLCKWFEDKKQTASLAISLPSRSAMCLVFIHEGNYVGSFDVENQKFSDDRNYVYELLKSDPQAILEASILPPEMTSAAMRFGFNLTMAQKGLQQ